MLRLVSTRARTPYSRNVVEAKRLRNGVVQTAFDIAGRRAEPPPQAILTSDGWTGIDEIVLRCNCSDHDRFNHATIQVVGDGVDIFQNIGLNETVSAPVITLNDYIAVLTVYDDWGQWTKQVLRYKSLAQALGALRMNYITQSGTGSLYNSQEVQSPVPSTFTIDGTGTRTITVRVRSNAERVGVSGGTTLAGTTYVMTGGTFRNDGVDRYVMKHKRGALTVQSYKLNARNGLSATIPGTQWTDIFSFSVNAGDVLEFTNETNDNRTRSSNIPMPPTLLIPDLLTSRVINFPIYPDTAGYPPGVNTFYENCVQVELIGIDQL